MLSAFMAGRPPPPPSLHMLRDPTASLLHPPRPAPRRAALQACPELFVDMAEALGCPAPAPGEAVQAVLGAIRQLSRDIGIPRNLQELVGGGEREEAGVRFGRAGAKGLT